jgi:hypothetical protein
MGATITEKQSSTYWASLSPLAITSYAVFSDGSIQFAVRNSSMQTQTLSAIYLNDENALKAGSVTIQPASTSTVYGYVTNSANRCTAGTTFTYNVKLKYGSQYLQNKSLIGEKPLVGECISGGTTNGLVAVWHFDEGSGSAAYDCSGNANDGTLYDSPTWTTGKIGNALRFNGTSGYVRIPNSSTLNPTTAITITMWLKLESDPECDPNNNWRSILYKGTPCCATTGYDILLEETRSITWDIGTTDNIRYNSDANRLTVGEWTFLAVTYDSSTAQAKIYFNGTEVAGTYWNTGSGTIQSNTNSVRITNSSTSCPNGAGNFPGIIDEVRIYNRALSAAEIQTLYKAGR